MVEYLSKKYVVEYLSSHLRGRTSECKFTWSNILVLIYEVEYLSPNLRGRIFQYTFTWSNILVQVYVVEYLSTNLCVRISQYKFTWSNILVRIYVEVCWSNQFMYYFRDIFQFKVFQNNDFIIMISNIIFFSSFHYRLILISQLNFWYFFYLSPFRYRVPFIIQSIKYSLIINKCFVVFVPYIVYYKYITSQKSGFLLNLISKLPNMFISKMSFSHNPKFVPSM